VQNKVLFTTGNFPRCTPVCDLHIAFNLPYVYDYITRLYGQQGKVIKTMRMNIFAVYDNRKPDVGNIGDLKLVVLKINNHSSD
jgi:hypothetical protein